MACASTLSFFSVRLENIGSVKSAYILKQQTESCYQVSDTGVKVKLKEKAV